LGGEAKKSHPKRLLMEAAPRGGGLAEGGGGKPKQRSSEVIRRIHEETERVKRRLNESASQDHGSDTSSQQGRSRSPVSTPQRKAKSPADSFTDTYVQNYKRNNQQPPQQRLQHHHHHHHHHQFDTVSRGTEAALDLPLRIAPEPSVGAYFEDPVPANQMSTHLKSEHEAFKAKYVDIFVGCNSNSLQIELAQ
jgi:hypothetical protein